MRRNGESGQAIVAVALGLVVLLGMLGLGIDFGYLRYMKRQMQTAADAAAIAGSGMLDFGSSSAITTAAQAVAAKNGFTNGSNGVTIAVNNPPSFLATDPHKGDSKYVEVVISQNQPTFFAKAFGVRAVPLTTRAEGAEGGGNNCIFALDPAGNPGLAVDLLASITSQCGVVVESTNSSDALQCALFASISASSIGVVGGVEDFLCGISPRPVTIRTPNPADPLAATPKPAVGACGGGAGGTITSGTFTGARKGMNIIGPGTVTLNPGVYCGGIQANIGSTVNLNPGTYILTNSSAGGSTYGLSIDIGTAVTGNGVTFYNFGPTGGVNFIFSSISFGNVTLTAPTSGTYEGILFFQDPGNTTAAQIIGSSALNTTIAGTYYFPTAKVVFAFDGPVAYNILDAYDIEFAALTFGITPFRSSGFTNNYTSLANGSPVKGGNGVLVE
jgi:Putative Flp pilus-assembly TadE/G-like